MMTCHPSAATVSSVGRHHDREELICQHSVTLTDWRHVPRALETFAKSKSQGGLRSWSLYEFSNVSTDDNPVRKGSYGDSRLCLE